MRRLVLLAASAALLLTGPAQAQTQPAAPRPPKNQIASDEPRAPVPYEVWNGQMLFKMTIADREVWALLDTGAGTSLIDKKLATDLGRPLYPDTQLVRTASGAPIAVWRTTDVFLTVPGQFKVDASEFRVGDLTAISGQTNRTVGFVFGNDFLRTMVLGVDPAKQVFRLQPTGRARGSAGSTELQITGNRATLEIAAGDRKIAVDIDTGQGLDLCVKPVVWASLAPQLMSVTRGAMSDAQGVARQGRRARLKEIAIGEIKLPAIEVCEMNTPDYPSDGLLGYGVLSRFELVMDIAAGKLWLTPLADAPKAAAPQTPPKTLILKRPSPG